MFVFGALAGAWWVKHKEERKMWMRFRRDMIRDTSRKQSPCTDGDDGFEVIGKRGFTDSDKERLRDLGSQAKEIVSVDIFFVFFQFADFALPGHRIWGHITRYRLFSFREPPRGE
jgi:hypothetical protein